MGRIAENKRLLLGACAMAAVIFLWYSFIFVEQRKELREVGQDIAEMESLVSSWTEETRNLSQYHDEYVSLEKERTRFFSTLPGARQVRGMAEEIIKTGKSNECVVTYVGVPFADLFSPDNGEAAAGDSKVLVLPFQLVVRGHYVPIGRFLRSLADLPYFASFGELEISRISGRRQDLEANFSMMVYIKRGVSAADERL